MTRHFWLTAIVCLIYVGSACADEQLPFLPAEQLPESAKLVPADKAGAAPVMKIGGPAANPVTVLIANAPKVQSHSYMLRGKVKYEGVEKAKIGGEEVPAFLEMWSHFPGGGQFFTRTLANAGPMAKIEGTSDWRDVSLPFVSKPGLLPNKLVVNVVIPGEGTIWLTPLTLTEISAGTAGEWWSEPSAGLVGGIGGSVLGLLGGLIGLLSGIGVGRRFVINLCIAMIAFGAMCLVAGIVAVTLGQPWYVYYPFLLGGVISVAVIGFNLPGIRRRYDALELRRMSAMDA